MRLLLDTHVALWAIFDDPRLSRRARALILDPANTSFVSVASLWEIAIKRSVRPSGPEALPLSADRSAELFEASGFRIAPIERQHATAVEDLPRLHNDPFDRLLVAQALSEPYRLLTHDARLSAYSDMVLTV